MSSDRSTPAPRIWDLDAVVFDMDGVITDTARAHATCWAQTFDEYLEERTARNGEPFEPFSEDDYLKYVDGKPRYDGVRSFLESRGIVLPEGAPNDSLDAETVCGIGNRKNAHFLTVPPGRWGRPLSHQRQRWLRPSTTEGLPLRSSLRAVTRRRCCVEQECATCSR